MHARLQVPDFSCSAVQHVCMQAVAKVVVDLVTDEDGHVTDAQARTYKPIMKHEHTVYKTLKADTASRPPGIPATWCSGKLLGQRAALRQLAHQHFARMHHACFCRNHRPHAG